MQLTTTGRRDVSFTRNYPVHLAMIHTDAKDLGVLVDLNAQGICGPGVAPVDGIMPDDPAGRVVQRPENRVPSRRRDVHVRHQALSPPLAK